MDTTIAQYYNDIYSKDIVKYTEDYKESVYYNLWKAVVDIIKSRGKNQKILDIGCGCGQFAKFLEDEGYKDYIGFDFSSTAIDIARSSSNQTFIVGSAYNKDMYSCCYDIAILSEVLEHLDDDMQIINNIKTGTFIVATLPTFMCTGHLRCFECTGAILERYSDLINIENIEHIGRFYIMAGVKI